MTTANEIAENYIATWNETHADHAQRSSPCTGARHSHYVDPLMSPSDAHELSGMIGAVHDRFPGFRFKPINQPDGHSDYVRFAWGLGPENQEAVIEGSDIVETRSGRINRVVGFLDKLPAA